MKNTIKRKKGFTLVEMLGVLAIIAILIALTAVGVMAAINRSRIVSTVANFKNYETALLQYVALGSSGGTVPLTNVAAITDTKSSANETLAGVTTGSANIDPTQIHLGLVFYSTKTLDRYPTWRVSEDAFSSGLIDVSVDWAWSTRVKAFVEALDTDTANGIPTRTGNDWSSSIRCMSAVADNTTTVDDFETNNRAWFTDAGVLIPNASRVVYMDIPNLSMKDAKALSEELNGATLHDGDMNAAQERGRFIHTTADATTGYVHAYYFLGVF